MLFTMIFKSIFRSLQWRLVLIILAMSIANLIFVGIYINKEIESSYYEQFVDGIKKGFNSWSLLNNWDILDMRNVTIDQLKNEFDSQNESNSIYSFSLINKYRTFTICDMDTHEIVASSYYDTPEKVANALNELLKSENFIKALNRHEGMDKKLKTYKEGNTKKVYFDYAYPVRLKDGNYILYFRYEREEWMKIPDKLKSVIVNSIIASILASLILGYILSNTITVPIVNVMHKANRIADGIFDDVLEVKSSDEIGKLTNSFNYMAKVLKKTLNEISNEKNKIETILNYLTDGVLAYNGYGEPIHANPAAKTMLGYDYVFLNFDKFAEKLDLDITLDDIKEPSAPSNFERLIDINNRYLNVYFASFLNEEKELGGIITVLQDITKQHKLEMMRREFVANVSHELKTPLTSIKSYSETLLDGAMEDKETTVRFLTVINSEAERMGRLVRELLQLSSIDNHQIKWNMQEISLVELVKLAVEKIQIESVNKEQELKTSYEENVPNIIADYDKIEQVVINILSNAIKYTPKGGKIFVSVGKEDEKVFVKVKDTGIGIPEEDLPRIFERFYRVDKARSREMGGTGLGLAIAKELVEYIGGSIEAKSEYGVGTELTVYFPLPQEENIE